MTDTRSSAFLARLTYRAAPRQSRLVEPSCPPADCPARTAPTTPSSTPQSGASASDRGRLWRKSTSRPPTSSASACRRFDTASNLDHQQEPDGTQNPGLDDIDAMAARGEKARPSQWRWGTGLFANRAASPTDKVGKFEAEKACAELKAAGFSRAAHLRTLWRVAARCHKSSLIALACPSVAATRRC
jgi:hypothetical protein